MGGKIFQTEKMGGRRTLSTFWGAGLGPWLQARQPDKAHATTPAFAAIAKPPECLALLEASKASLLHRVSHYRGLVWPMLDSAQDLSKFEQV